MKRDFNDLVDFNKFFMNYAKETEQKYGCGLLVTDHLTLQELVYIADIVGYENIGVELDGNDTDGYIIYSVYFNSSEELIEKNKHDIEEVLQRKMFK